MAITIKRKSAKQDPKKEPNAVIQMAQQRIKELPPGKAKSYLRGLAAAGGDPVVTRELRKMMEEL